MKVLLLANPGSVHTIRWAHALSAHGITVSVFGVNRYNINDYKNSGISIISKNIPSTGFLNKARYVLSLSALKKTLRQFKPDIVHAHYATSYGLLGRLSGFKPLIISVWGTDVFDFPNISPFHKYLLKFNLKGATRILSTSKVMAEETMKYINNNIDITPFGVDLTLFKPEKKVPKNEIIIGTIKTLSPKYGIDVLIKSFEILRKNCPHHAVKLIIGGEGEDRKKLLSLVKKLGLQDHVQFLGKIEHVNVSGFLNQFDIFAALSIYESFGVAAVEASACGVPAVVSDAGGLPEVIENGETGIVVPKNDPIKAAEAFKKLIDDPVTRKRMGEAGRKRVEELFNWANNVDHLISIYDKILGKAR